MSELAATTIGRLFMQRLKLKELLRINGPRLDELETKPRYVALRATINRRYDRNYNAAWDLDEKMATVPIETPSDLAVLLLLAEWRERENDPFQHELAQRLRERVAEYQRPPTIPGNVIMLFRAEGIAQPLG